MRVISGKFKGKLILEPSKETTRPAMHRIKDSVFNTLGSFIKNIDVCDLFGGSGGLGIEAISRGAKSVVFVEKNSDVVKVLKKNLENCNLDAPILNCDYLTALEKFKNEGKQFDLFIVDPPFKSDFGVNAIEYIKSNNLLKESGQIEFFTIFEGLEAHFEQLGFSVRIKTYGGGKVVYFLES